MALPRFLLDTNIISELRKPRRDPRVVEWVRSVPPDNLFISVVTVGEITRGIAKRRRAGGVADADALQEWFDGVLSSYGDRIISIDVRIASRWGLLLDKHPQLATDMLLAATALVRGLTVATRNVEHFETADVPVFNPFH
jgi:predicted nucleic acid-binding protein